MLNWRATLGLVAVVAVLLAMILPVPAQNPAVHIAAAAHAASPPAATDNDLFRGMIAVEGKEIPLPAGEWRLAGRAVSAAADDGGSQRSIVSVALVRLHGMAVDAAVLVQTNRLDTDAAWGKATACDRSDLYFARIRYASDHDGSCAYAAYVDASVPRDSTDAAWQQTLLRGAGTGWHFPSHWVEAAYRITDPRDAIQVRYLFDVPAGADGRLPRPAVRALVAWTEASWSTRWAAASAIGWAPTMATACRTGANLMRPVPQPCGRRSAPSRARWNTWAPRWSPTASSAR